MKAPRLSEEEIGPYSVEEVQRLLAAVSGRRDSARWSPVPALGLRPGEALGLKWTDVDLDKATPRVRRGRLPPKHAHGCDDPCGRLAGYCPLRVRTRPATDETKSRAGRRTVGLPAELVTDPILTDVAKRVDGLIWKPAEDAANSPPARADDQGDDSAAGARTAA